VQKTERGRVGARKKMAFGRWMGRWGDGEMGRMGRGGNVREGERQTGQAGRAIAVTETAGRAVGAVGLGRAGGLARRVWGTGEDGEEAGGGGQPGGGLRNCQIGQIKVRKW
jgi:hypothetical protein